MADESDDADIAEFHAKYFENSRNPEKFRWIKNDNPAGQALYALAFDGERLIGTQAVLPYLIYGENRTGILTGKSEDTFIHPNYRGIGLLEKMYKLLFQVCKENAIKSIWGYTLIPGAFEKVGFQTVGKVYSSYFISDLGKAYNLLALGKNYIHKLKAITFLSLSRMKTARKANGIVRMINTAEPDFMSLAIDLEARNGDLFTDMNCEYLTWRHWNNPYYEARCVALLNQNVLLGYCLYFVNSGMAYIQHITFDLDKGPNEREEIYASLIREIVDSGAPNIHHWSLTDNLQPTSDRHILEKVGFTSILSATRKIQIDLDPNIHLAKELKWSKLSMLGTN